MDVNPITPVKKTIQFGRHTLTVETGELARQAHGAVMVNLDDTCVLVTVVGRKEVKPGQDFFPLTVDYMERTYAAGSIPGGFFKREGRPYREGNPDLPPHRSPDPAAVPGWLLQ